MKEESCKTPPCSSPSSVQDFTIQLDSSRLRNSSLKLLFKSLYITNPNKRLPKMDFILFLKNTRCAPYSCLITKLWLIGEIENNLFAQWALGGSELELVPW
jgi:hypothetical protein